MQRTFIVEAGNVDSQGDKVLIEGLKIPDKKLLLLHNFDAATPITKVDVFKEDGVVKASGDIPEQFTSLYPAIGYQVLKATKNKQGGRTITEAKLFCIGLSESPNLDHSIQIISD